MSGDDRPEVGGKRPRSVFRNLCGPSNFSIVVFLDKKGKKTDDQEIVPTLWIRPGVKPTCFWPSSPDITRRKLDKMVSEEFEPNDKDFDFYPIRILHTGLTHKNARDTFEQLAVKSSTDENTQNSKGNVSDSSSDPDTDNLNKRKKRNASKDSKGNKKKQRELDKNESFEYVESENESNRQSNVFKSPSPFRSISKSIPPKASTSRGSPKASTSRGSPKASTFKSSPLIFTSEGSPRSSRPTSKSQHGNSNFSSSSTPQEHRLSSRSNETVSRQLSFESTGAAFVTHDEFEVFKTKLFSKLNIIQQLLVDLNSKSTPSRELIKFPAALTASCDLPAKTVGALEALDDALEDGAVQSELVQYLSQLGGRKYSDFLFRSLPTLISDEVCFLTNWSGSKVEPGTLDMHGAEITRPFKKTFGNLTNIVKTFCCASRLVAQGTTDKEVESYIMKWLLSVKDRVSPRKHIAQTQRSPRKGKASPKKRKRN